MPFGDLNDRVSVQPLDPERLCCHNTPVDDLTRVIWVHHCDNFSLQWQLSFLIGLIELRVNNFVSKEEAQYFATQRAFLVGIVDLT